MLKIFKDEDIIKYIILIALNFIFILDLFDHKFFGSYGRINVTLSFFMQILITNPPWRIMWRCPLGIGAFLSQKIYPDLNGTYDMILDSNYNLKQEQLNNHPDRKEGEKGKKIELLAEIKQSLFSFKIIVTPKAEKYDATRPMIRSVTVATKPFVDTECDEKGLYYVYSQKNINHAETDDALFFGAGRVQILERKDQKKDEMHLVGSYWTNRAYNRGLNAAGNIELKMIKSKNIFDNFLYVGAVYYIVFGLYVLDGWFGIFSYFLKACRITSAL